MTRVKTQGTIREQALDLCRVEADRWRNVVGEGPSMEYQEGIAALYDWIADELRSDSDAKKENQ